VAAAAGRVVTLDRPLRYTHWGRVQGYGRFRLDERGEVNMSGVELFRRASAAPCAATRSTST
jgi:hypothetical protein